MSNENILQAISCLVANAMNSQEMAGLAARLDQAMPDDWTDEQKAKALADSVVYALVAEQPGYPDTGLPGYLSATTDLRAAILHEIDAMLAADFDRDEHAKVWQQIRTTIAATPEADFLPGIAVNCPDDYLLTLDRRSCADVLREKDALPAWGTA